MANGETIKGVVEIVSKPPLLGGRWQHALAGCRERLARDTAPLVTVEGRLTRMVGLTLEAVGCQLPVGGRCHILRQERLPVEAEVVGFAGERLFLMPIGDPRGLVPNAPVIPLRHGGRMAVGEALLGRVLDGGGRPLDDLGPLRATHRVSLEGQPINPLARQPIREPMDVGVAAINALLTIGRGQRMGLFAGSGVGKSVLLGMMTRYAKADVIVVGLIGERGREVQEFIENILGKEGLARSVVVATPADHSPLMRIHGAMLATSIAEYFRDQGKQVLLLMDSLTRFGHAQRELALAIGEPPATRGYPPSVFAKIPQLLERAGNGRSGSGSITAFYTVLTEGDDPNDPVADSARAILDGHIVLSRRLAEAGHYPAIDIEASISRVMSQITVPEHQQAAQQFKQIYSLYSQNQDLISVGAYSRGSDSRLDEAVDRQPQFRSFLQQDMSQSFSVKESLERLQQALKAKPAPKVAAPAINVGGASRQFNSGGYS